MKYREIGQKKQLSRLWIVLSMLIFLGIEALFGGVIGRLLAGRFVGQIFRIRLEILLMLFSYFAGGLFVGVISPGIRLFEPAIGAFFAVMVTFLYGFFTPHRFFAFSLQRLAFGGMIAFVLALAGADLGERIAARLGNRTSQKYTNR